MKKLSNRSNHLNHVSSKHPGKDLVKFEFTLPKRKAKIVQSSLGYAICLVSDRITKPANKNEALVLMSHVFYRCISESNHAFKYLKSYCSIEE